ncbi:MAG: phosphate ABC transporter substrate-binding protein [Nitrospirota bacterium]|nr:phosphate ABC transporter substrate-binding protein [Nitrospirota bacterium]
MAPLMADIGKRFEAKYPGIRVDVQTGGSSRGMKEARSGLADIGMASRALAEIEQDLIGIPVARDGISIILHASNTISSLSEEEIIAIFTGKITNWKSLGGPDAKIVVVNKAEGRATLELFLQYFHLDHDAIQADVIIGENEQGIKTVAGNSHAIAYVSIGTAEYDATHGIPIRLLPLNDIPASMASLQSGAFPLSRPLTLITTQSPSPLAKRFLNFARSTQVHDIITKHYFTPASS